MPLLPTRLPFPAAVPASPLLPACGYKPLPRRPADLASHLTPAPLTLAVTAAAPRPPDLRPAPRGPEEGLGRHCPRQGSSATRAVYRHGMRATLTPLVTQLGADIARYASAAPSSSSRCLGSGRARRLPAVQAVKTQDR